MGVIPNPKMAFIFPISCILALIFSILIKYFPKCAGKGSFPKSQIKSLLGITVCHHSASLVMPNGDPQGGFFYPTLTLMIDSYSPLRKETFRVLDHAQTSLVS